jgi:hypothetical protein
MPAKGQFKKNATADSKRQRAYNSSPEQKKNRASRNAARREAERDGKVRKGDGKDVDHHNMNPKDNRKSNLKVMDRSKNRAKNQWAKKGR